MYCPKCGTEVADRGKYCSNCGRPRQQSATKFLIIMTSLVAIIGITAAIFLGFQTKQEVATKEVERRNVEQIKVEPEKETPAKKQELAEPPKEVSEIINSSQPMVFTIFTEFGQGSGFLINRNGDVLTNAHVVEGFHHPTVKTIDGNEFRGTLIGYSNTTDIAVIRVPELANREPLQLEGKQSNEIGDEVIALGSPQGFENTATLGNISGIDRTFVIEPFRYEGIYQTSAPIAPGSSGGPLLSKDTGEVIAINSARHTQEINIGFSIPLYQIMDTINKWTNSPMTQEEIASLFYYDDGLYYYQDSPDDYGYFENGYYEDDYLEYYEIPYDDSWYDYWYGDYDEGYEEDDYYDESYEYESDEYYYEEDYDYYYDEGYDEADYDEPYEDEGYENYEDYESYENPESEGYDEEDSNVMEEDQGEANETEPDPDPYAEEYVEPEAGVEEEPLTTEPGETP